MAFSVTYNSVLRNDYGIYRNLTKTAARSEATDSKLSVADSSALNRSINKLRYSSYDDRKDGTDSQGYAKSYVKNMKAFMDTYNYTLESSKKSSSREITRQVPKMKQLVDKYKDQLGKIGISYDKDGYLKLSASSNVTTTKRYETLFGKDSSFMKDLNNIAGNIKRHVNVYL